MFSRVYDWLYRLVKVFRVPFAGFSGPILNSPKSSSQGGSKRDVRLIWDEERDER